LIAKEGDMTEEAKQTMRDSAAIRWMILFLVSILMFATYWFQDFYSGLKPLMESQLGISSTDFSNMISLTTIANLAGMIILGGILLDRWGIRLTTIVFGIVATLGGLISALGANDVFSSDPDTRLKIMILGRIVFGIGLETTCVIITRAIVKWFKGYELALAMAINMGVGRLGSAIGTAISPDIGNGNVPQAVTLAATIIGVGFILLIIYLFFDVKIDRQMKGAIGVEEEPFRLADLKKLFTNTTFLIIAGLCVAFYSAVFPFMQYAPDLLYNEFGFSMEQVPGRPLVSVLIFIGLFVFGVGFPLIPTYIKKKQGKYISIAVILVLFIGFIYALKDTFAVWVQSAPKTAAFLPMGTILFTPIFGRMVDKKGKAASIMLLGAALLIFSHIIFAYVHNLALCYISLFALGIAFSLVPAAMWPSVARIVPERRLGTAYAAMFTIQNWGLFLFFKGIGTVLDKVNPEIVNKIQTVRSNLAAEGLSKLEITERVQEMRRIGEIAPYDYTIPISLFIICGVVAVVLAFMLKRSSQKHGYGLEEPSTS
jgi:MFS family permease